MTITYTGKVSNARLCAFSRLLFYWKGSIYKLMYKEMLIFCGCYALLSLVYRLALNEDQKRIFEKVARHCEAFTNLIPLSFVLGFYVAIVVGRWWNQYLCIPWPDRLMSYLTVMLDGVDERSRIMRRTLMRYLTLTTIFVFQLASVSVKKRFPTMEHLLEAGVITEEEVKAMDDTVTPHGKWWLPFIWSSNILKQARKEGRINHDYYLKTLIDELQAFRGNLGMILSYDWISIPLVYTQVTTLAVYSFFVGCLFGRQFLDTEQRYQGHEVDLYIPFFTLLQFFFYMGWLKVAEQLINPFGEDDDDFEVNWIIDRNYQISLLTVDDLHGYFPKFNKDIFFGDNPPENLPYTKSSVSSISKPHMGSTADLSISEQGMTIVPMEPIIEGQEPTTGAYTGSCQNIRGSSPIPTRSHRFVNNIMNSFGSPYHSRKENNFLYPHGQLSKAHSEIDGLHPESHGFHHDSNRHSRMSSYMHDNRSMNASQSIFSIDMEETDLSDSKVYNPAIEKLKHDEQFPFSMSRSSTINEVAQGVSRSGSISEKNRNSRFNVTPAKEDAVPKDAQTLQEKLHDLLKMRESDSENEKSDDNEHTENKIVQHGSENTDSVIADATDDNTEMGSLSKISRRSNDSESSNDFPLYEKPEGYQTTITSLTPLLPDQ